MSTTKSRITYPAISREIKRLTGESVTSGLVGMIIRNDTSSARVSALIEQAKASLEAQAKAAAKATPKKRATRKAVAA